MSIRHLSALFEPSSIALIGAGNRPGSVGHVLSRNLFEGGFAGPIMTVNPKERAIRSTLSYLVFGEVLKENERMLAIAAELGFAVRPAPAPSDSVRVELATA